MRRNISIIGQMAVLAACLVLLGDPSANSRAQRWENSENRGERDRQRGRDRDNDEDISRDQDQGSDDENGDHRGERRRRRPTDEERRRWYITRLDRNGDGKIERDEVDDRYWSGFEQAAKDAGFDTSKAISVESYLSKRKTQETQRARQKYREENPTAFMSPAETGKAPGFDTPLTEQELVLLNPDKPRDILIVEGTAKTNRRTASKPKTSGTEDQGDRTTRYAASLIDRYDKNHNSVLDKDEWKEMRGDPEKSDLNNDGKITKDELVERFRSYRRGDSSKENKQNSTRGSREARTGRSIGRSRDRDEESNVRNTYRFTPAADRLPGDARSWIERYDDNGDAQVSMAEFSSTWTSSKVREFEKYDLNGDGLVTAKEYLAGK